MMDNNDYNHFVCIVASNLPDELIKKYLNGKFEEPYVKYSFKDAHKIRCDYITLYEKLISNTDNAYEQVLLKEELSDAKDSSDTEFFYLVTEDYEHDKDTGDALCYDNPNGKYSYCEIGKKLSTPFILKNGSETFQAKKKDIDWNKIHLGNTLPYEIAWNTVIEKKKPKTDMEKTIYKNMSGLGAYLKKFETKENYIASSCSFWGYAFLSEETGWVELEPNINQFEWVSCFFERFIVPLQEEIILTIYECRK